MKQSDKVLVGAALIGGIILVSRNKPVTPPTGSEANISAQIGAVNVAQSVAASLSSVDKEPGDVLTASMEWINNSTDAQGNPIAWPFDMRIILGRNQGNGVVPWEQLGIGVSSPTGTRTLNRTAGLNSAQSWSTNYTVPTSPASLVGQSFDVEFSLYARPSNPDGTPGAGWVLASRQFLIGGLRVVAGEQPANINAGVTSVNVAQTYRPGGARSW